MIELTCDSIVHFILLLNRIRAAYRSRFWHRPWQFPNGQIKLDFSIKFLGVPEGNVSSEEGVQR